MIQKKLTDWFLPTLLLADIGFINICSCYIAISDGFIGSRELLGHGYGIFFVIATIMEVLCTSYINIFSIAFVIEFFVRVLTGTLKKPAMTEVSLSIKVSSEYREATVASRSTSSCSWCKHPFSQENQPSDDSSKIVFCSNSMKKAARHVFHLNCYKYMIDLYRDCKVCCEDALKQKRLYLSTLPPMYSLIDNQIINNYSKVTTCTKALFWRRADNLIIRYSDSAYLILIENIYHLFTFVRNSRDSRVRPDENPPSFTVSLQPLRPSAIFDTIQRMNQARMSQRAFCCVGKNPKILYVINLGKKGPDVVNGFQCEKMLILQTATNGTTSSLYTLPDCQKSIFTKYSANTGSLPTYMRLSPFERKYRLIPFNNRWMFLINEVIQKTLLLTFSE